jgi:hypothetical protein
MVLQIKFRTVSLVTVFFFSAYAAVAAPGAGPVIRADEISDFELDLAQVRGDLLPLLLETARVKDEEAAGRLSAVLDLVGVGALDRLRIETMRSRESSRAKLTLTLDPQAEGGLLSALFSAGGGRCRFGRYVRQDDLLMFASLENFSGNLEALLSQMSRPEVRAMIPFLALDGNGEVTIFGVSPRRDVLPLLAGELDVMQLRAAAADTSTAGPTMVLAIAAADGFALRDRILEIAARVTGGEESAPMMDLFRSLPAEEVGEFQLSVLPMGLAFAVSRDFLVLATDPAALRRMLIEPHGDLDIPTGRAWLRVEGEAIAAYLEGRARAAGSSGQAGGSGVPPSVMAEAMPDGPFERVELLTLSAPERFEAELRVNGSVWDSTYRLLCAVMAEAPRQLEIAMRQDKEKAKYRAVVGELDAALTRYGQEHESTFPADLHELVTLGYLESFPSLAPTPAGEYLEGGYSYLPLRDDEDRVVGHYLFVYGGGEGTGYDVFTPDNLAALDHFVIGSDGQPDGVASFCWDGCALEQVEAWQNK